MTEKLVTPDAPKSLKTNKAKRIRGIKRSTFSMPYLALSIIFVIVPLFIMLYYAFTDLDGNFSLANFAH